MPKPFGAQRLFKTYFFMLNNLLLSLQIKKQYTSKTINLYIKIFSYDKK